jgi:molybdopterin molybdotransferase
MSTPAQNKLLSFAEARQAVEAYAATVAPTDPELTGLLDAVGLALAEDLRADRDFPPFPRATRDGYAVRSVDTESVPARLKCVGSIKAGAPLEDSEITLEAGEAAEIMTGAPVPAGADAVVMVEYTKSKDARVTVKRSVGAGENVVAAGAEARRGDVMVPRGTRVRHAVVAVAAAVGRAEVAVHRRPKVALLATGDELVDINLPPGPNEIRNSNTYSLAAQVYEAGGEATLLPVAPDDPGEMALLLRKGLDANLLLLTGGVSMGKYDLVEEVLASAGAEFFFTGVAIQPGKPVVFGQVALDGKTRPFFGLPGNPVSTMVTFRLFVRPVLDALAGAKPELLSFGRATLKERLSTKTGLTRFLPGRLSGTHERPEVELVHWQGSGDLMAASKSNCYIVVPPDREKFEAGEAVTILLS